MKKSISRHLRILAGDLPARAQKVCHNIPSPYPHPHLPWYKALSHHRFASTFILSYSTSRLDGYIMTCFVFFFGSSNVCFLEHTHLSRPACNIQWLFRGFYADLVAFMFHLHGGDMQVVPSRDPAMSTLHKTVTFSSSFERLSGLRGSTARKYL